MNEQIDVANDEQAALQQRRKKERLVHSMVLNGFVLALMAGIAFSYILPRYDEISVASAEANQLIAKVDSLRRDGMPFEEFLSLGGEVGGKSFRNNPIFSNKQKITEVMKKDPDYQGGYYEWLNQEVGSQALGQYDDAIAAKQEILGNIIPTFTEALPGGDLGFDKNRVTLASFVRYIEENIFKTFKVSTYGSVGIDKVVFDNSKNSIINIGTFKVDFMLEGQNSQLMELIEYIQNSGKVKVENGKLVSAHPIDKTKKDPSLSDLNNLLITIDSLESDKSFAIPEAKNTVKLTLSFYVKGRTYSSLVEIRTAVSEKVKKLKEEVTAAAKKCEGSSSGVCATDAGVTAVSAVKNLVPEITALDARTQEVVKNSSVSDISSEFEKIFSIYSSARTIEAVYAKHKAVLERNSQKKDSAASAK